MGCQEGHLGIVKYLCEAGADKDKAADDGATPLYISCEEGHLEIVKYLCEAGADKDKAMNDGITPLYISRQKGHLEIVKYLWTRWRMAVPLHWLSHALTYDEDSWLFFLPPRCTSLG